MIKLITPPVAPVLTVAEMETHLRTSGESAYLETLEAAAVDHVREVTGRQLSPATYETYLDQFPSEAIEIPLPPLVSVESVIYTDTDGTDQTFLDFTASLINNEVIPTYGTSWPRSRGSANSVTVQFIAGYSVLPPSIRAALLLIVGDLYENREATSPVRLHENKAVERLLAPYRVYS